MVEASQEVTPPQKGKYEGASGPSIRALWMAWSGGPERVDPKGWTEWPGKSVDVL
ncbi:hypothetical protein TIFTF001_008165 [Ficus carica]|uniref:Uncharacterized protein n=1 Tax=Ficus carica TaxID=3494 RepID=A0AA88A4B3_FICCA|nr:hypothetical protein TIFTF001_008165 [Ficus carica]